MAQNKSYVQFFTPNNPAISSDGSEAWTTVTERENNVFAAYSRQAVAATHYAILIDKSDTTGKLHPPSQSNTL